MKRLYDERCLDLAKYFAAELPEAAVENLAAEIQERIEDWLRNYEREHSFA